jgi:hypothetical protein
MALVEFYRDKYKEYPLAQLLGTHTNSTSFVKNDFYPAPDRMIVVNNPWNYSTVTDLSFESNVLTNAIPASDASTGNTVVGYVYTAGSFIFEGMNADTKAVNTEDRTLMDKFWIHFSDADFTNNKVKLEIGPNDYDDTVMPGVGQGTSEGGEPSTWNQSYVDYGFDLDLPDTTNGDMICVYVRYVVPQNEEFGRFFNVNVKFSTNIDY